jgi:hypothetical protein
MSPNVSDMNESLIAVLDADCGSADSFCGQQEVAGDSPC